MRVDRDITASRVRLVDQEGQQLGIVALSVALEKAAGSKLNLVEVSPMSDPPVCRIINYGKQLFDEKKRRMQQRKKQHQRQLDLKEIKFRLSIEDNDYNVKIDKLRTFLESGYRVKISVRFSGREMAYQERGRQLIKRIYGNLSDIAMITQESKLEGRQLIMLMVKRNKGNTAN